ncbi:histidine kinase [Anopheles sinensis]|uniref:Histidine kinase n=1 Tax=Anopheles sinensis TaxID=74873 RepID=A0A084VAB7_ANOSI|nr:histidine kinase [Anopheles sinensis]
MERQVKAAKGHLTLAIDFTNRLTAISASWQTFPVSSDANVNKPTMHRLESLRPIGFGSFAQAPPGTRRVLAWSKSTTFDAKEDPSEVFASNSNNVGTGLKGPKLFYIVRNGPLPTKL